jgi:hypothetical protein
MAKYRDVQFPELCCRAHGEQMSEQTTESIIAETKNQTERASALRERVSELALAAIAETYGSKDEATRLLLDAMRAWEAAAAACREIDTAAYEDCVRESLAYQEVMREMTMKNDK